MGVYLRAKFQVSSIILTSFRQGGNFTPPSSTSKQTPKKPTQIRVNFLQNILGNIFWEAIFIKSKQWQDALPEDFSTVFYKYIVLYIKQLYYTLFWVTAFSKDIKECFKKHNE